MNFLRLLLSLFALASRLAGALRERLLRKKIIKELENERLSRQTEILRNAWRARNSRRNADRRNPAGRLQDDGFRRNE